MAMLHGSLTVQPLSAPEVQGGVLCEFPCLPASVLSVKGARHG